MYLPPHEFEHHTMQKIDPLSTTVDNEGLVTLLEVYVDDFIAMSNNTSQAHLLQVSCAMLHGIHAMFPPPEVTGHNGFDPVALSKQDKGKGTWEHIKEVLGCIMDCQKGKIQLPIKKMHGHLYDNAQITEKRRVTLNESRNLPVNFNMLPWESRGDVAC